MGCCRMQILATQTIEFETRRPECGEAPMRFGGVPRMVDVDSFAFDR